mmetsp:Transcript_75459/g.182304  ORF Transcript_75459/g.182304 Transcript_75459/m.182304 type:complete len:238 (-) Transcript_75459:3-716(-)
MRVQQQGGTVLRDFPLQERDSAEAVVPAIEPRGQCQRLPGPSVHRCAGPQKEVHVKEPAVPIGLPHLAALPRDIVEVEDVAAGAVVDPGVNEGVEGEVLAGTGGGVRGRGLEQRGVGGGVDHGLQPSPVCRHEAQQLHLLPPRRLGVRRQVCQDLRVERQPGAGPGGEVSAELAVPAAGRAEAQDLDLQPPKRRQQCQEALRPWRCRPWQLRLHVHMEGRSTRRVRVAPGAIAGRGK